MNNQADNGAAGRQKMSREVMDAWRDYSEVEKIPPEKDGKGTAEEVVYIGNDSRGK